MLYEIEDKVPLPRGRGVSHNLRETIKKMIVGESFLCPPGAVFSLRNMALRVARELNIPIATRIENGRVRVWRT